MNRRTTLTLGATTGSLLACAFLPVAVAFADTGSLTEAAAATDLFPAAPGPDAFTLGDLTFDPYQSLVGTGTGDPTVEGFNSLGQGTGTPPFFETGSTGLQGFEVFSPASGSTAASELGTIQTTENVSSFGSITNTGFDVTGLSGIEGGGGDLAALPALGTVYDVTNFGSGFENVYTDVPGAAGAAGTVTDTFVTPFGDENLSSLVTAFDLSALDPGAAFGVGADAAGAAADTVSTIDPLSFLGI